MLRCFLQGVIRLRICLCRVILLNIIEFGQHAGLNAAVVWNIWFASKSDLTFILTSMTNPKVYDYSSLFEPEPTTPGFGHGLNFPRGIEL